MTDITLSAAVGGSGLPSLNAVTGKVCPFTVDTTTPNLASLAGGTALTTVLDLTVQGVLTNLFIQSSNYTGATLTLPQIILTLDGDPLFDDSTSLAVFRSLFLVGLGMLADQSVGDNTPIITGSAFKFKTLKLEIDSTAEADTTLVFGDIEVAS